MLEEDLLVADSVFRVGRVTSVEGRRVRVSVDKLKNGSHLLFKGGVVRNVAVGSYIKIVKGFMELIAKVDGERVEQDRSAPGGYQRSVDPLARELEVSLVGYLEYEKFERGVRELPLLDNECFILTEAEFNCIHTFVAPTDVPITIGALAMEPTQIVSVGIDAIFASHVGIFGNTGSGKSYTLAKIYHELFQKYAADEGFRARSQFVLIDFNGEYVDRDGSEDLHSSSVITDSLNKQEYVLSTRDDKGDKLPLSSEAIQDATFWTVLLDATEKTQAPFLSRVLTSDYWDRRLPDADALLENIGDLVLRATKSSDISVDRQTVMNLLMEIQLCLGSAATAELQQVMDRFHSQLNYNSSFRKFYWGAWSSSPTTPDSANWENLTKGAVKGLVLDFTGIRDVDLVRFKIILQYYSDIISGYANREHLGPLIKRMETRVPDIKKLIRVDAVSLATKPLVVVSLRDVNLAMRKVIPMLVCKHLYDEKKNRDPGNEQYLNLIIDEAHNILSTQSTRESEAWRDYRLETFEEIVKEGRKFGVFLTIASQRPHDISETIISQLHNYFLHRLVNNLDIHAIEKAVAYLDQISFESLPILPTGTCVIAGVSAQIPIVVKIGELPKEAAPNSRTMSITTEWAKPLPLIAPETGGEIDAALLDTDGSET